MTTRRILLVYAALALLTAFYPVLRGELPVPAGGVAVLVPGGLPPPRVRDELGDVPMQFLPWSQAVLDAYRAGRLPLRFAANGCGTPLWANPQAQALTPTTLFAVLWGAAWGSAASAAAKLMLASAGALLLALRRGLSRAASVWVGIAYGFSLHATAWMHFPHTWPIALLPFTLLCLEGLARGEAHGFRRTLAVVFLLLLGGYPEGEFFVAVAGGAFFLAVLFRQRVPPSERLRRLGLAAGASILALGLSAVYTLPAGIAIARSERSVQVARSMPAADGGTLKPADFLRPPIYAETARFWIVPEAQGNPRDRDKFGPYSFAGRASGSSSILILAFALATFFRRRPAPFVAVLRWTAAIVALYMLWYRPLSFVLSATPGLREIATRLTTNRAGSIFVLALALLAASELDRFRAGSSRGPLVAGLSLALAATGIVFAEYVRLPDRPPLTLGAARASSFGVPALLLIAALVLVLRATAGSRRTLIVLALAGTALDLLRIGARFNPGTPPADYFPQTQATARIREASRGGRFASSDIMLSGMAYMYGLEDVRVHDPMALAAYADALGAGAGYTGPAEHTARVTRLDAPFLDFLNVRVRLGSGAPILATATPAAVFPQRLVGCRGSGDLLARLSAAGDFERDAFAIGGDESFSGRARVISFEKPRPEELRIRVRADAPRVLVIPETTDGGWTARAGDRSLPVFTANGAFLGVRVPAGENEIVCRYAPPGFRTGVVVSVLFAAILAGVALVHVRGKTADVRARK